MNVFDWSSPAVVVPKKVTAARSVSPTTISGNFVFLMANGAPTFVEADHVLTLPWSLDTATSGLPNPSW